MPERHSSSSINRRCLRRAARLYRWLLEDSSSRHIDLNNLFERSTVLIFIIRSIIGTRIIICVNVHYSAKRMHLTIDSVLGVRWNYLNISIDNNVDTCSNNHDLWSEVTKLALGLKDNHPEAIACVHNTDIII